MDLSKDGKRFLRAKADASRAPRMPPVGRVAEDLRALGCPEGPENRFGIRLGIKNVDRARRTVEVLRSCPTHEEARHKQVLLSRFATIERSTHLEEREVGETPRLIPRGRL